MRSTWYLNAMHRKSYMHHMISALISFKFEGTQTDAIIMFIWHEDMIGVVQFIDECLERILYTSDQP